MRGLGLRVGAVLDRRLAAKAPAPLAVALSGGGDSLALLILTLDWAAQNGRAVQALVFDHGLHPDSAAWTRFAADAAQRLGAVAEILCWEGEKPTTGLPAAARAARHAALADAARETGAGVLLMGHTADDRLEAARMRAEGSSVPDPKPWAPSPAWPEGRGLFLLRPLLEVRRQALRDFLKSRGETWLEDPANDNPRFARARARAQVRQADDGAQPAPLAEPGPLAFHGWREAFGVLETQGAFERAALAAACLCVAGTARPPAAERLDRLMALTGRGDDFTATLAGARVQRRAGRLTVTREMGRLRTPAQPLDPSRPLVWDGRFELNVADEGMTVRALGGIASRLPKAQRLALGQVPAAARPSLPALVDADGNASCPILADGTKGVAASSLVMARFAAACGQIAAETA